MKNIILPTDFSLNAFNAARYALHFYREDTCNFILLNAYEVGDYHEGSAFVPVPNKDSLLQAKKNSEEQLLSLKAQLRNLSGNLTHTFEHVTQNLPLITAINLQTSEVKTEVVIIGTQGVTDAHDVAFGINTINIMEDVRNVPILAVPSHVMFTNIGEIVLATGFKMQYSPRELEFLKSTVLNHHAHLRILHINETEKLSEQQIINKNDLEFKLTNVPHSFHNLSYVTIPLGIYSFTESRGSEMIAFIKKKHNFLVNLLADPLYKKLGNYSQIPVLVMG
ncbi:hypothetical protein BH23BAC2_BH23BAC2_09930 [soil metagenome]